MFGINIDKQVMVEPEKALKGRETPMPVAPAHVVLGTPLTGPWPEGMEVVYFAMGCFWGAERIFWQTPGVHSTAVGYMGGWTRNPTYEETCTSLTGHAETVQVVFDPAVVSLEELFAKFWENHDPTTLNRQGADIGTQYRSVIFYHSEEQRRIAVEKMKAIEDAGIWDDPIVTQLEPFDAFYPAEAYHQEYYARNPNAGYCQFVIKPKVAKFRKEFMNRLKTPV